MINAFIQKAGECGYNTTEALEVLMQKAIDGLLPRKTTTWVTSESPYGNSQLKSNVWDISGCSELRINAKPYPTRKETADKLETSGNLALASHFRIESATTILKDYLVKENLAENVVEGPMAQEIFGSMKVCVKLNTFKFVAVDLKTQELTIYSSDMRIGETNERDRII